MAAPILQIERPEAVNSVSLNSDIERITIFFTDDNRAPKPLFQVVKRLADILIPGLFILLILSWLLPLLALLIKAGSKGPVFFFQKRNGLHGNIFTCIKLRTMRVNNAADVKQAVHNDERITRIGIFLRNTNLDELPQFWNVLKGDMSIVGPRPHMLYHTNQLENKFEGYERRLLVKPGITGLAQIKGWRGPTPTHRSIYKRIQWDIYYVNHQSALLDTYIFFKTIGEVFSNLYQQIIK